MTLVERYRTMRLIREAEERIRRDYASDAMKTPVHLCIGAEAIRMLWDGALALDHQSHQLAALAGRLTHTVQRFAQGVVDAREEDPKDLLTELGAALEVGTALERTQDGLAEALSSLCFAWRPRPTEFEGIQTRALSALAQRLQARSQERWRPREP